MQLEISNQYKNLISPKKATKELFQAIEQSRKFPISEGELSVVFVSDEMIGQIHDDFMNDPSPTDVITFPANEVMESAGEIIVSVDHALAQSAERNLPFSWELSLYLLHGWLHLAGYDDREEKDRLEMRAAEEEALEVLRRVDAGMDFIVQE